MMPIKITRTMSSSYVCMNPILTNEIQLTDSPREYSDSRSYVRENLSVNWSWIHGKLLTLCTCWLIINSLIYCGLPWIFSLATYNQCSCVFIMFSLQIYRHFCWFCWTSTWRTDIDILEGVRTWRRRQTFSTCKAFAMFACSLLIILRSCRSKIFTLFSSLSFPTPEHIFHAFKCVTRSHFGRV